MCVKKARDWSGEKPMEEAHRLSCGFAAIGRLTAAGNAVALAGVAFDDEQPSDRMGLPDLPGVRIFG